MVNPYIINPLPSLLHFGGGAFAVVIPSLRDLYFKRPPGCFVYEIGWGTI